MTDCTVVEPVRACIWGCTQTNPLVSSHVFVHKRANWNKAYSLHTNDIMWPQLQFPKCQLCVGNQNRLGAYPNLCSLEYALPLSHFWYNANIANIVNLDSNGTMAFKTHKKIFIKKSCHFGSYVCYNKLSLTRWLKIPEIYSLIFLVAGSLKLVLVVQKVQSCFPSY